MMEKRNLTGQRFGQLVALREFGSAKSGMEWLCRCDCGNEVVVARSNLVSGNTRSCGCKWRNRGGESATKVYHTWQGMKRTVKDSRKRLDICEEWKNYDTFKAWAIENGLGNGVRLTRKNKNLGFSPENCICEPMPERKAKKEVEIVKDEPLTDSNLKKLSERPWYKSPCDMCSKKSSENCSANCTKFEVWFRNAWRRACAPLKKGDENNVVEW